MIKNLFKEFKEFLTRGNVIDMAVGIIIGSAFGKIITSLVNDILMPPIGLLLGNVDFSNLYINLSKTDYANLAEAKKAGAPTINYGAFLNIVIDFILVAAVIFILIKQINLLKKKFDKTVAAAAPTVKECPFCALNIPLKAVKCGYCGSALK
ncbi:MAG: large-conductance mechanosensitive channel protein MscL [Elusimicrobia bacterium]|nr:large-conductance mechanosensitive channel protein MscL [Elusimicrobiota bacterium]